jgi:hypothetical protein
MKCHAASRGTIPRKKDELKEGMQRLTECMNNKNRIVKASDVTDSGSIDGWWMMQGDRKTYYVIGTVWRSLFASDKQRKLVEEYLAKKGILLPGSDGKPTKQPLLPNAAKKAPRCYVLRALKPKRLPDARPAGKRGSQKVKRPKYR